MPSVLCTGEEAGSLDHQLIRYETFRFIFHPFINYIIL